MMPCAASVTARVDVRGRVVGAHHVTDARRRSQVRRTDTVLPVTYEVIQYETIGDGSVLLTPRPAMRLRSFELAIPQRQMVLPNPA